MKISILTPSYNSGQHIRRAIRSVLVQDYEHAEHIIVDGGSTDNTLDILRDYEHLSWISEPDEGQSDAMNKAFDMSSGDIILYLNADDEVAPGTFTEVADYFNRHPDCKFLLGDLKIAGLETKLVSPPTRLLDILSGAVHPPNPVCYYYRREVQEQIGKFPVDNHYTMDYWFLLRVFKRYKIHKLDRVFGTFHLHDNNKTLDHSMERNQAAREGARLCDVSGQFKKEFPVLTAMLILRQRLSDWARAGRARFRHSVYLITGQSR